MIDGRFKLKIIGAHIFIAVHQTHSEPFPSTITMTQQHRSPTPLESLIGGSISGMASVIVCHPLDVIRTKIQVDHHLTLRQAIVTPFKESGFAGFYKGFTVPFAAQIVYKSIIFATNTASNTYLFHNKTDGLSVFLSGTIAGSVNSLVVSPVEIIRTTQIMAAKDGANKTMFDAIKHVVKHRGPLGLWVGLPPTIARDGPGMGCYMIAFSQSKKFIQSIDGTQGKPPTMLNRLVSGALAGIAFWTYALPIDTIKTIIETSIRSTQQAGGGSLKATVMQHLREMKFIDFYRALPIAYIRGIPSAAVTLTVYDLIVEKMVELNP